MKFRVLLLTLVTAALAPAAEEADFGLLAIGTFENVRLNAYCTGDGSVVPLPCTVTFEFHDARGATLKQTTITLQPGTTGFLDFAPAPAGIAPSAVQINPCFKVLRGIALASLEVFDSFSQRSRILINWGDRSLARRGDVDFAPAGLTAFDTARVGVVCTADGSVMPPPCDVTFEFHDSAGRTIKQSRMTLQPGASGFLDLHFSEVGGVSRKVQIDPCFKVAGGAAVGSLAIIDNFTGLTVAQAYPAAPASGGQ
jgi:hypothetical protein